MQGGTMTNTPRHIQAAGLWLLVGILVGTPVTVWLIRRYVDPASDSYVETWPEIGRVLNIAAVGAGIAVVLILIGAALRLTRRP